MCGVANGIARKLLTPTVLPPPLLLHILDPPPAEQRRVRVVRRLAAGAAPAGDEVDRREVAVGVRLRLDETWGGLEQPRTRP